MPSNVKNPLLPDFIPPMLAKSGQPFDSDKHLFEIKWDGTRTLCFIDKGAYRLLNRRRVDMTDRYPEFAFLSELPSGTALDGELVVLTHGKPDFGLLQSREHSRSPLKIRTFAKTLPATLIVFDILYDAGRSVMNQPLRERRRLLEEHVKKWNRPNLVSSEGVIGAGKDFFQTAVARGLEGVMAKDLSSKYAPGQRGEAWIKIKRSLELYCMVIGFEPSGKDDFRSLLLA